MNVEQRINELQEEINKLKYSTTIPFDVEQAFRTRLRLDSVTNLATSAKSATSENQSVNEAGSGSYSVLKAPNGFRQFSSGGTTFFIPYYTD